MPKGSIKLNSPFLSFDSRQDNMQILFWLIITLVTLTLASPCSKISCRLQDGAGSNSSICCPPDQVSTCHCMSNGPYCHCMPKSHETSCTTAKKVECVAAALGCGTICICDFPACECCAGCLACVTATSANCCECLFPGWSGCNYINPPKNSTGACASARCYNSAGQICCPDGQMATCQCMNGYAECGCA